MMPASQLQPIQRPSRAPISVAAPIWATAPGRAIARTASSSRKEKCMPTPNMRRITPISASSFAIAWSATKPGVKGPTATPAIR